MEPLLVQLRTNSKMSMLRNATWTLSNFCRGKPQPLFPCVKTALGTLVNLIYNGDEEVLTDACWALSYLSDGENEKIQAMIEAGVCGKLVELLLNPSPAVQTPAEWWGISSKYFGCRQFDRYGIFLIINKSF